MQQLPQTPPQKTQPLFSEHSLHDSLWQRFAKKKSRRGKIGETQPKKNWQYHGNGNS
jgi:hypothetical protein